MFTNLGNSGSSQYGMEDSDKLCVGLSHEKYSRSLKIGEEYKAEVWTRNNSGIGVRGSISQNIKIPEDVEEGKFYKVQLLLKDEQQEIEEARQKELQRELSKINIDINVPAEMASDNFVFLYKNESISREESLEKDQTKVVFNNIETLGGDILVICVNNDRQFRTWAYIHHLDKRDLTMPRDADLVIPEKDLIDVQFTVSDSAFFGDFPGLGFFVKDDSYLPIFFPGRVQFKQTDDELAVYSCEAKVPAGKYHVFACSGNVQKEKYLGAIEIKPAIYSYALDSLLSAD